MKPIQLLAGIALLCLSATKLAAQPYDTSTTKGLIRHILHHVDKSQIPTGFLEEYGAPMLPMQTFNGTLTDSNRIEHEPLADAVLPDANRLRGQWVQSFALYPIRQFHHQAKCPRYVAGSRTAVHRPV